MKVKVSDTVQENFVGFIDHIRRRPGDVFTIPDSPRRALFKKEQSLVDGNDEAKRVYAEIKDKDGKIPSAFSFNWMTPVSASVPERVTTAQTAIDAAHDRILSDRAAERGTEGGGEGGGQSADVI